MGSVIKAGIPHMIKVNTKADKFGIEDGFKLTYFNDATKEMVKVTDSFFELEEAVDDVSTTVSGNHSAGVKEIHVADVTGFDINTTCKVGGNYYRIVAVDTDNNILTLRKGLVTAVADGDALELSGRTGTYGVYVTFPAAGTYTIHVTNFAAGMDNEAAPLEVKDADIDDVKSLLDAVKTEVDSVKSQVDTLDEEELNGISEKVDALTQTLDTVHTLIKDSSDVYIEVAGDETGIIGEGETLTGDTSGAQGTVQYVDYDADADVTKVTLQSVSGAFEVDETVNDGTDSTTGKITKVQNNVINSVIEYVKAIEDSIAGSAGVENLKTIGLDIEHLINGDAKLEDGSDCPTAGKGIVAIFDELVSTHSDVSAIKTLAEDGTNGFEAIKTAVVDARSSIEGKIAALVDEDDANSLASKVNAVKSVVDANKGLLENDTYGLAKLMDKLGNISDLFADGGDIEVRFDAIDSAINDVKTAISDQTTHLDGKFQDLMDELESMKDATKYTVIA